jgi:hypothetical protein
VATYLRIPLSGSTHGRPIPVVATAIGSSPTTIHTAEATTTDGLGDNVTLFATNIDTVVRTLTLGWGGTGSGDQWIQDIPSKSGLVLICADLLLRNALVIAAAASVTNVINILGYVNRVA